MLKVLLLAAIAAATSMAGPITYTATLSGPNESPPTGSPGIGLGVITFDVTAHTMAISFTFSGLTTGDTAAHIHCCTAVAGTGTAGVATATPTFTGFPGGLTSGSYSNTFDMTLASSYNPAFVTAQGSIASAEAALAAGAAAGMDYLNIHTTQNPGGEIRGFLAPVPEPGTFGMVGGALAAAAFLRRKFRT